MTSLQKIANVEKQFEALEAGRTNVLNCPYCHTANRAEDERLCCALLAKLVAAIMLKKETRETGERIEQIMEKVSRN